MTNDTTTLNGALQELGETLADNLTTQGVTSSASEGLTTLAGKVLDIQGGGGSNIVVFENQGTTFNYTRKRSSDGFTVNIPSGVTTLEQYCFYYCYGLKDVNFPSTITTIDNYAFYYCTGLTSVTVPSGVTSIGQSGFGYCSNLSSITLPSTCQTLGSYCFSNCTSLTEVVLPEGLKTINSYAFQGCSNLETVHIPSTVNSLANNAFYNDTIEDYELYWDTSSSIITYSSTKMPTSTNTKFTVPVGTYDLYVAKGYPSDKIVERMKIEFSQDSYVASSGSVTLTATLLERGVAVSGVTVTLTGGATTTTATTDSNGVATFNLTGISSQTTYTATYESVSDSCIVYTTHDYSIEFSQDTYSTSTGEATLEITLLDHGSGVSGATVSVTGSDSSSYSGLTNSSGVAEVTVADISVETTFTATYQGVSDTCTVTVGPTILFYDPCNTTYDSSNYGTIIPVSSSTTTDYTAYDSTNNCYKTRANGDWGVLPITALNSADNYKIEATFKRPSSNAMYQGGFSFANPSNPNGTCWVVRMRGDGKIDYCQRDKTETTVATGLGSAWIRIELTVQGQSIGIKVYNGDTLVANTTATNPLSNTVIGLHLLGGSSYGFYVKEIKAEAL